MKSVSTWRRRAAAVAAAALLASPIALSATSASAVSADDAGYEVDANYKAYSLGYVEVASDGGVFTQGKATFFGSLGATPLNKPIVGVSTLPAAGQSSGFPVNSGYYMVASDGGVFAFGDKQDYGFFGSTGNIKLNSPIVGMAIPEGGKGYFLVAADGGVFAFGAAKFQGSLGGTKLDTTIVGMAVTTASDPNTGLPLGGYYLLGANGHVWSFGNVGASPETLKAVGAFRTTEGAVGIATGYNDVNDNEGLYIATKTGSAYAYDANNHGQVKAGTKLNSPVVGISSGIVSDGYDLVAADGGVFSFGYARFHGSTGNIKLNKPIVGIATF